MPSHTTQTTEDDVDEIIDLFFNNEEDVVCADEQEDVEFYDLYDGAKEETDSDSDGEELVQEKPDDPDDLSNKLRIDVKVVDPFLVAFSASADVVIANPKRTVGDGENQGCVCPTDREPLVVQLECPR
ncbi:hypothetical protein DXG03_009027 [Asterophora parasitica]|uniref:Uncharacterized protein n=1 Tax=Asterophora parasitica TaxID=117018 RepID=A0A9P7KA44_9AGAR|nr:hypothetical protein DXG03_009027 [Asterophora parasitica]